MIHLKFKLFIENCNFHNLNLSSFIINIFKLTLIFIFASLNVLKHLLIFHYAFKNFSFSFN